jgi:uncharacterized protein YndB with AHSA1/START domain
MQPLTDRFAERLPGERHVRREVEIDAPPEEVWEAISTEEGRARWLEEDPVREIHVEPTTEPGRIVWWWWRNDRVEEPTRVELLVVAAPAGTRVIVIESAPLVPLARLQAAFTPALV